MLHPNARFAEAVEATVARLEKRTDAEVVVVAARRSGQYRDLSLLVGTGLAWLLMCVVIYSPWEFSGYWLPIELPLIGAAVAYLTHRSPRLLRLLSSTARRQQQVRTAAAQAFMTEAIDGTRNRTGILIYLSVLEARVVVLPDAGIKARVPPGRWNAIVWGVNSTNPQSIGNLDQFIAGLEAAGRLLAELVPPTDDNPDELSNAPRIRS